MARARFGAPPRRRPHHPRTRRTDRRIRISPSAVAPLIAFLATGGALVLPIAANVAPVAAYPAANVSLSGHGFGHGRGLGQYGALGYAVNSSWTYQQILDHFYGGTTADTQSPANPQVKVRISGADGSDLFVTQQHGGIHTNSLFGPFTAIWAHQTSPGHFAVYSGPGCQGPWTLKTADAGSAVTVAVDAAANTTDRSQLLAQCGPPGTLRWYRGTLTVLTDGSIPVTVNILPMEQYLRGVVPRESSASWGDQGGGKGMNALRAQAVAARSYAASENRYGYAQTCDTTSCQVYGGAQYQTNGSTQVLEDSRTDKSVTDTAGLVRTFGNHVPARTEFSSSTGGYTAGGTFPAVVDLGDSVSPYHDWTAQVPVSTIQSTLPQIGTLTSVDVTQRNGLGDLGGRVVTVVVRGTSGNASMSGNDFRSKFGLKSDWFAVMPPKPSDNPMLNRGGQHWFRQSVQTDYGPLTSFDYGIAGDQALSCAWKGDGKTYPVVYRNGTWFLAGTQTGTSIGLQFNYGLPGDTAVCGDWNGDGKDTIGVVRQVGGFKLWLIRNTNGVGDPDYTIGYGVTGDVPIVGDWNGDGKDSFGVYRGTTFLLRDSLTDGDPNISFGYGVSGDLPVAGDWNGDGISTVGVYRGAVGTWFLRNSNDGSSSVDVTFKFGVNGDRPLSWH